MCDLSPFVDRNSHNSSLALDAVEWGGVHPIAPALLTPSAMQCVKASDSERGLGSDDPARVTVHGPRHDQVGTRDAGAVPRVSAHSLSSRWALFRRRSTDPLAPQEWRPQCFRVHPLE